MKDLTPNDLPARVGWVCSFAGDSFRLPVTAQVSKAAERYIQAIWNSFVICVFDYNSHPINEDGHQQVARKTHFHSNQRDHFFAWFYMRGNDTQQSAMFSYVSTEDYRCLRSSVAGPFGG